MSVSKYKCQLTSIFKRGKKKHKPITKKENNLGTAATLAVE